jgi:hypothetical protein
MTADEAKAAIPGYWLDRAAEALENASLDSTRVTAHLR